MSLCRSEDVQGAGAPTTSDGLETHGHAAAAATTVDDDDRLDDAGGGLGDVDSPESQHRSMPADAVGESSLSRDPDPVAQRGEDVGGDPSRELVDVAGARHDLQHRSGQGLDGGFGGDGSDIRRQGVWRHCGECPATLDGAEMARGGDRLRRRVAAPGLWLDAGRRGGW